MNLEATLRRYKGRKKKPDRLVVGKTEAEVAEQAAVLRAYGYRECGEILQSQATHEFYQWWEFNTDERN